MNEHITTTAPAIRVAHREMVATWTCTCGETGSCTADTRPRAVFYANADANSHRVYDSATGKRRA